MHGKIDPGDLLKQAWRARDNAYTPYSNFAVGAALLTSSEKIFLGCNVENISFGLTICAERVAAAAAVQAGDREFVAIAIVADTVVPIVPCGACRQFLAEFNPELMIFREGKNRNLRESSLRVLLPFPKEGMLEL